MKTRLIAAALPAAQLAGIAAAVAGVFVLAGLGVGLVVGGVLITAAATLREAGRI